MQQRLLLAICRHSGQWRNSSPHALSVGMYFKRLDNYADIQWWVISNRVEEIRLMLIHSSGAADGGNVKGLT